VPAKSANQYGIMAATIGGSPTGVPKEVAQHFMDATPAKKRSKFAKVLASKKKKK
jgi:hypothetical protein